MSLQMIQKEIKLQEEEEEEEEEEELQKRAMEEETGDLIEML